MQKLSSQPIDALNSAFSCSMGPEMRSFFFTQSLNHSQVNLFISSLPVLQALLCFEKGSLVSSSCKILSWFFKILGIRVFLTKSFSAKLCFHTLIYLHLTMLSFSFNVKVFFICCTFGFPILSHQNVFRNECKSYEISSERFINAMFLFFKMNDKLLT